VEVEFVLLSSGLTMVDVAIGLIVVYVVMSMLCSSANEGLETILRNRSRQLELGIREILDDPTGTGITQALYNHPLISGLFQGKYDAAHARPGKLYAKKNLPSYIPSANFALAVLDIVLPATATQASGAAAALIPGPQPSAAQALRDAAMKFPVAGVGRSLTVLIDASANDMQKVRAGIEKWFDSSMDRISGWYKRRTQIVLFVLAVIFTGALNVDTVRIVDRLLTDPSIRNSLVSTAQEYARNGAAQGATANNQTTWTAQVKANEAQLKSLGIPLGWNQPEHRSDNWYWLIKFAGLLATALAATMGAPFWFDVLNRFVVIRSTIKPQEKA
jgi:hypothetical protein